MNKKSTYQNIGTVANQLNLELEEAQKDFETNKNLAKFKKTCSDAIKKAEPEFTKHRGWHKVPLILRCILGVLAALTIIPGIVVATRATHGYTGTFFKTPKTNSVEKLGLFEQKINSLSVSES